MSKGIVMFAYNGAYDYIAMARVSASLAKRYLRLPVTLITDQAVDYPEFDSVIVQEKTDPLQLKITDGELKPWHNQNRFTAYNLTPYDQTLLIDADYFVMNSRLKHLFDTNLDFACYDTANDIADVTVLESKIGNTSIPMQWATVIYFTKNELAESVFNFIEYIKQHYEFYSLMYNFRADKFRNDYALSIALQTLTGYSIGNFAQIPGNLDTLTFGTSIIDVRDNGELLYMYPSGITRDMKVSKLKNTSLHILHKINLFGTAQTLDKFKILYEKSQQF
jgi:hypothetical protein